MKILKICAAAIRLTLLSMQVIVFLAVLQAGVSAEVRRFSTGQAVDCLAFSPDGKTIAAGGDRMQIFDAATGHPRFNQVSRHGTVLSLAFSPDGSTLAFGIEDDVEGTGRIELRDGHTGRLRRVFRVFGPQETPAPWLAFSPDGTKLVGTGGSEDSSEGELRVWQVKTGRLLQTLNSQEFSLPLFSRNGQMLITVDSTTGVHLVSVRAGRTVSVLPSHLEIQILALSPDGVLLAVKGVVQNPRRFAPMQRQIEVWNVRTRTRQRVLAGFSHDLDDMRFAPDGRLLTVGGQSENGKSIPSIVQVWNTRSGTSQIVPLGNLQIRTTAFSPDGRFLAVATSGTNSSLYLWPFH